MNLVFNVPCIGRIPTKFNNYSHFVDNALIKITRGIKNNLWVFDDDYLK